MLEWPDPPWSAGHWIPEQVAVAGGTNVFGQPGSPSQRVSEEAIFAKDPDWIFGIACGFVFAQLNVCCVFRDTSILEGSAQPFVDRREEHGSNPSHTIEVRLNAFSHPRSSVASRSSQPRPLRSMPMTVISGEGPTSANVSNFAVEASAPAQARDADSVRTALLPAAHESSTLWVPTSGVSRGDERAQTSLLNGIEPRAEGVRVANNRPSRLTDEQRALPADRQIAALRAAGFVPVGDFSIRLDPRDYGLPIALLQDAMNTLEMLNSGAPSVREILGGQAIANALDLVTEPMLQQAELAAPILAETNADLPQGFKNALRSGRANVEAIYTGYSTGRDDRGPFIQMNSRVFVQKR